MRKKHILIISTLVLIVFGLGFGANNLYYKYRNKIIQKPTCVKFLDEIYSKIQENYWEKIKEEDLNKMFYLGLKKVISNIQSPAPKNKRELEKLIIIELKNKPKACVQLADIVLRSLKPLNRNALYGIKDEKKLKDLVDNRNPKTGKIEPTIYSKRISPNVLYLKIKKFSPTTFDEFQKQTIKQDVKGDSLILDLRGNIGGSIDILPYFLGPFIGKDQYAYEFYHQGERIPFKTKTGWLSSLVRYKKVVILIDNKTQSTAELMASVLKKYNVGVLVGSTTRGWGTVERVFPIENQPISNTKYSLFLVHSITLREDNQPIEGRGVNPDIDIKSNNWKSQLFSYFSSKELIESVDSALKIK